MQADLLKPHSSCLDASQDYLSTELDFIFQSLTILKLRTQDNPNYISIFMNINIPSIAVKNVSISVVYHCLV